MAAYTATVSLVQILHPHQFPLHLRNPEIESLYSKVLSLQSILEKIFPITNNIRQEVNDLDGQIRDAIYKAQDEIEFFIIKQRLSSENVLKEITAEIDPLSAQAQKIASSIKKLEMASSPAVVSLANMLHPYYFPLDHLTSHVEPLYEKLCFLESCLEKICNAPKSIITVAIHDLDIQIRVAASEARDTIESFVSSQIDSSEIESSTSAFLQILQVITASIDPLAEEVSKIVDSIEGDSRAQEITANIHPLAGEAAKTVDSIEGDAQAQDSLSENIAPDFRSRRKNIVGQEEQLKKLKEEILIPTNNRQVLPITGMPGTGKTTLARRIYEDSSITDEFEIHGWVTVTQDYQIAEIFSKLFHSLETKGGKAGAQLGRNDNLQDAVYKSLHRKMYLIVVDDIWAEDVWDKLKLTFPDDNNGSRIVLTTRSKMVAKYAKNSDFLHEMQPLSLDHSWELLTLTVFGGGPGSCPPHLKDVGRKISKNCKGHPLSLIVVGGLLSEENMTVEYWKCIEGDTADAAAKGDEAYLDILYLSYYSLPGRLKGCFLYVGAFPENSEILVTKLVQLWVAEGFLKPSLLLNVEQVATDYLDQLIDRNLLEIRKFTSNNQTKSCGMNNSLRNLAVKESHNEKFFHSRRKYAQELLEGTNAQRRISVHRNILMCMEEVHNSIKQITCARTLLFVGAHHHHPLPYCLTFDLLRVLDALTVYFVGFPNEIVKLIHLRYLSFTYNRKLPSTLSNLQKLQILIVRQHPKLIFLGKSILPDEIWGMTQLRHLLFTETDLPKIPCEKNSILFANLQTLSNVSAASCTKEVLQNMPNLKRLSMWTESPGPVGLFLDQVEQLESFKFTVLNPVPKEKVEFLPKLYFPKSMRKLRLSGCSLPWEAMTVIGQLPFLEVLKLREIAFKGDKWCPRKREFRQLKFLLLEYLDLACWEADNSHFPRLQRLILRHCYELAEIPEEFQLLTQLELIELVDCIPDAVESAEDMKESVKKYGNTKLKIQTYSSWE